MRLKPCIVSGNQVCCTGYTWCQSCPTFVEYQIIESYTFDDLFDKMRRMTPEEIKAMDKEVLLATGKDKELDSDV